MSKKIELKEKLTYEEHKKLDDFFRQFNKDCFEIFGLLKKSFRNKGTPVKQFAKAINCINTIPCFCETKSCFDCPTFMDYDSEEFGKWQKLYRDIGSCMTEGYYK